MYYRIPGVVEPAPGILNYYHSFHRCPCTGQPYVPKQLLVWSKAGFPGPQLNASYKEFPLTV